ncbi:hypothetical protein Naga_102246g1 [Nannochloropsis gaditana]|uniref:Uncharacterized protein n=1 Tax=Nannochloropsis gaditana TaxID=72520 RepID=W7T935_9STRA|nr:hypothetical protein Naga_102246g1 [Nannochloropsis gaditana]
MSGPAGLDLGQLSANYVCRETVTTMEKALLAIWTTYTNEFRQSYNKRIKEEAQRAPLPFLSSLFRRKGRAGRGREEREDAERALRSILLEAQGFLGMWLLFLTIACPVEIMEIWPPSARGRGRGREGGQCT